MSKKVAQVIVETLPPAIEFGPAYGMALYSARAVLGGQAHDLIERIQENFL
jgi:pyruvate dehydrogenase (quinone)